MKKKTLSVILFSLTVICFILTAALLISTVSSAQELKNIDVDTLSESIPGGAIIGALIGNFAVYGSFMFFGFIISAFGFFSSLINIKISQNTAVKRASYAFWCFYAVLLLFIIGTFVYTLTVII
ncbi:MAG: hypothetical protein IKL21_06995 [Clostridia bacterium]|nr:hypothetical protein [Clostridia bacterium]